MASFMMSSLNSTWQKQSWRQERHATRDSSGYNDSKRSKWQEEGVAVKTLHSSLLDASALKSDLALPGLGIGTWAWGDEKWGFGRADAGYDDETLQAAFHIAVDQGVNFFDTSEVYGGSHAETVLGRCLHKAKGKCSIATKWHPRSNASVFQKFYNDDVIESMRRTLMGSKERLGLDCVDLFQLHSGSQCYGSLEDYADGLATMVQEGHARHVGVSNVGGWQVQRIHERLKQHGIQLFSNQVEFSLLEPGIVADGTLETCNRLGVKILAYCPLAMGRLTGRYSAENEPQFYGHGNKNHRYHGAVPWPHTEKVLAVCRQIAERRSVSVAQVALNWCISHGTTPIPGAKTSKQALDNCQALSWSLSDEEMHLLDEAAIHEASAGKGLQKRSKGEGKGKGKSSKSNSSRKWSSKAS